MVYLTKGEFLQALKDYERLCYKIGELRDEKARLHYLLYEKIKSPLDYDVVGYKNGEPIRQIKRGGRISEDLKLESREKMEEKYNSVCARIEDLKKRTKETMDALDELDSPLKDIVSARYLGGTKLKALAIRFGFADESGIYKYIQRNLNRFFEM